MRDDIMTYGRKVLFVVAGVIVLGMLSFENLRA
jgi:hypothetical protein